MFFVQCNHHSSRSFWCLVGNSADVSCDPGNWKQGKLRSEGPLSTLSFTHCLGIPVITGDIRDILRDLLGCSGKESCHSCCSSLSLSGFSHRRTMAGATGEVTLFGPCEDTGQGPHDSASREGPLAIMVTVWWHSISGVYQHTDSCAREPPQGLQHPLPQVFCPGPIDR